MPTFRPTKALVRCSLWTVLLASAVQGFSVSVRNPVTAKDIGRSLALRRGGSRASNGMNLEMCICINCALVDRCAAYKFVEEKHGQPHVSQNPDFEPRNGSPTIQVYIRKEGLGPEHLAGRGITTEYDVTDCEDYVEEQGKWMASMPKGTLLAAGFDPDFVPT